MTIKNLEDLYRDQLQDLHSALGQSMAVVGEMGQAASNSDLADALIAGQQGIAKGIETLASLCAENGVDPNGEHCKGMEGIVAEARKHALDTKFADEDAQDAAIITQYQRMAHYAIAGYGCVRTFANRLGHDAQGARLQEELDQTHGGDKHMTQLAEGGINAAAMTPAE
ncbi:DUF892 family protein [Paracoccus shanxieyensis]|uniref:DUF892 family protein n=1 Tax=Paracoccus shanxieyensis TaxID=2675752 RepID=A0A6L6J2B1_9RHOB|nr:DUF892 family protein [Paracoccus shanxieyensis]MTH64857.1 DUF892 family protein [Paracoccus shanxieyensis]MTH87910.1 DUF892 family protein [Paracoccus shanxieyensis]